MPGNIRDTNRPALIARLRADGFVAVDLGMAADDEALLTELLVHATSRCDAVVASGGVSVGDRDFMKAVLKQLGGTTTRLMEVAVKPAKPFAFGMLGATGTPVFGLPGNPVAALVSYELFARPALRLMAGQKTLDRPRLAATVGGELRRRPDGTLHLLPVTVCAGTDGELRVLLAGPQGPPVLRALAEANALALLPDGHGVRSGERVEVLLLDADQLRSAGTEERW